MYENNEKKLEKIMCLILKNFKKIRPKNESRRLFVNVVLYVAYWYRKTASCDL